MGINNIPHDFDLSLRICEGLRPEIIEDPVRTGLATYQYREIMNMCWDSNPNNRPSAGNLARYFYAFKDYLGPHISRLRTAIPSKFKE